MPIPLRPSDEHILIVYSPSFFSLTPLAEVA